MRRIRSLILLSMTFAWSPVVWAWTSGGATPLFAHYQQAKDQVVPGNEFQSEFWNQQYQKQSRMRSALALDIAAIFRLYLDGKLPSSESIQAALQENQISFNDYVIESSYAIVEESVRSIKTKLPKLRLLSAIESLRSSNELIPLHFRVHDDEKTETISTYYERGTHKIKMALNSVQRENWFVWFCHEYLHYFDPLLRDAEKKTDEISRLDTIASWVRERHESLTDEEEKLLQSYFSDLTDLSIKAEWRDWVTTSLIAEKMFQSGLIDELPPCLGLLSKIGFGVAPLNLDMLKVLWWQELKKGFYVEPTGLFTNPWLKQRLIEYVNGLDPMTLPIRSLIELAD